MSSVFVVCANCRRLMIGQKSPWGSVPQPHACEREPGK